MKRKDSPILHTLGFQNSERVTKHSTIFLPFRSAETFQPFRFRTWKKTGLSTITGFIPVLEGSYFGIINGAQTNHSVFLNPFHSAFGIPKGVRFWRDGTPIMKFRTREIGGLRFRNLFLLEGDHNKYSSSV